MYIHTGRGKLATIKDPVDQDSVFWIYLAYGGYTLPGQSTRRERFVPAGVTIDSETNIIVGGTVVEGPTAEATREDASGRTYYDVYKVRLSVTSGADAVEFTHRITLSDGQTFDRTVRLPVVVQ